MSISKNPRKYSGLIFTVLLLLESHSALSQAQTSDGVHFLIQKFCIECHGRKKPEAGLDLRSLKFELSDNETFKTWSRIYDRLASGEMPPADEEQPPSDILRAVLDTLDGALRHASLTRQKSEGRVALRRLNRTQHENTLNDLLGVSIKLAEVLPDDGSVAGFDTVSDALDVSSTHLLRYQSAADLALDAAITTRPPESLKFHATGRKLAEGHFRALLNSQIMVLQGERLNFYAKLGNRAPLQTVGVPATGIYRLRFVAQALNTGGVTLPLEVRAVAHPTTPNGKTLATWDLPPDKPGVFDLELVLQKNEAIRFTPWQMPNEYQVRKPLTGNELGFAFEMMELEGPLQEFPSLGHKRLFGDLPLRVASIRKAERAGWKPPGVPENRSQEDWRRDPLIPVSENPQADGERLVREFLPRALRRPVDGATLEYYTAFFRECLAKGAEMHVALRKTYKAILSSPNFVYFREEPGALDDHAIASRLSYFLWSTMPDTELLDIAAQGKLREPSVLRTQVERMLSDDRSHRFIEHFTSQWLELRNLEATSPDPKLYAEFDPFLLWSMQMETVLFFREMLHRDRGVAEFVHSDWSMLNQRLAQHYGIRGVTGGAMHRVSIPPESHRGGVLTQASILKVTADGTKTSPILRGKWVLEKILGTPPSPPPPNVSAIEPDIRGSTTIRQQLEKHKSDASCASCHKHIDPPGFALESFDVIGGWREFYRSSDPKHSLGKTALANYPAIQISRGLTVEIGGTTAQGRSFENVGDYKSLLLEDKELLARNLVKQLLIYATGADVQYADRDEIRAIAKRTQDKGYGLRSLVHELIQSRLFLQK